MGSSEKINYALRPNKNVERKLIFEGLRALKPQFDIANYCYIGLGSLWFIDFILAHKLLSISDMISIEADWDIFTRACYNKPYSCIEVLEGDTGTKLPGCLQKDKQYIVWLDYDSFLSDSVFEDLALLCERLTGGSIVMITLNAHINNLTRNRDEDKKYEALKRLVGELMPPSVVPQDLTKVGYPSVLCKIVNLQLEHRTRISGREERYHPIFNFSYQDGAPMITVGGMIASEEESSLLRESDLWGLSQCSRERTLVLSVPPLTLKEKTALDQLLPDQHLSNDVVFDMYGISISEEMLLAYQDYYLYYPVYGELQL